MSYPTRGQVKQRYQQIADDWPQAATSPFNEQVFQPAFDEAYEVMYSFFLKNQIPRIELMACVDVPPGTTEITPADVGITDFGDYIFLRERILGSNEKYRQMLPVDVLPQRQMETYLRQYNWRNNKFYFVGATAFIDLEIKYDQSATPPTNDNTVICVDSCINFLANYAFGRSGGRKGYKDEASQAMLLAVGSGHTEGKVGGQLLDLIGPLVRSRQKVQIAHRPYQAGWGRFTRWGNGGFFVGPSQQGTTGGGSQNVPIQLSSESSPPGIVGNIDGFNAVFVINIGGVVSVTLYRNGVMQTQGADYTLLGNQITFFPASIPVPTDVLTAEVWITYNPPNPNVATTQS